MFKRQKENSTLKFIFNRFKIVYSAEFTEGGCLNK